MSGAPRKVAILGGGAGALAAAFELSQLRDWKDRFDITVYQMGWRLGGKCASGRNRDRFNRIEEHGIHLWLGYYENAFAMMQKCYAENARPLTAPLATWKEAFKPFHEHVMEDRTPDGTTFWPLRFHCLDRDPGDGGIPSHWELLCQLVEGIAELFSSAIADKTSGVRRPFWANLWHWFVGAEEALTIEGGELLLAGIVQLLREAGEGGLRSSDVRCRLIKRFGLFLETLWRWMEKSLAQNVETRRLWYLIDFGLANVRGFLADDIINKGFSSVDHIDYRAWLRKHGASRMTVQSQAVNWIYHFTLHDRSPLSTGVVLHYTARAVFTAKGALYWKMQGGMGDVVFAPLYEVLKKRGVRFRFFHRVRNVALSENGDQVAEITLGRQATPKNREYEPLFNVRGVPSWPSEPLYEDLVEGDRLKEQKINLESFWTPWNDVEEIRLRAGKDFDHVVLGMSLASIPIICSDIVARKPAWKAMVDNVRTTATQAFQVWTHPDASGLGFPAWRVPSALMLTAQEPINSWADMSDTLRREEWPASVSPNHVGYLCGVMDADIPAANQHDFPAREQEKVRQTVRDYLEEHTSGFWPAAQNAGGFNWELLVDAAGGKGPERLDAQYIRTNIDPSERYVLSAPGTTKYRLDPANTGVSNLTIAGDWVSTPMNAGSVEAAVMGGKLAARAISGEPIPIEGEDFAYPERARIDRPEAR